MSNRGCWIVHPETGELIPKHLYQRPAPKRSAFPCPMVMRDIEPYQSMADGSIISSRSQHRDHLRAHDMVELGNEMPSKPKSEKILTEEALSEAWDQCEAGKGVELSENAPRYWEGSETGEGWQDE